MRDLKLQVETDWSLVRQEWDVKIFLVVAPGARYEIANYETSEADPMFSVVDRLRRVFE